MSATPPRTAARWAALLLCGLLGGFADLTPLAARGSDTAPGDPVQPEPKGDDPGAGPNFDRLPFLPDAAAERDLLGPSTSPVGVPADSPRAVWGIINFRGFPVADQVASNGVEFKPLFSLDLNFNLMLWRQRRVYLFADSSFWGQKAAPGITNPSQGAFDFSKREFDLTLGAAWNYAGNWEARVFAYSMNNLNRGDSPVGPSGFNDGVGLENRYYLGETYARLGTAGFDQARATFLSLGYYPTKTLVDANGNQFTPGPFARAYLTLDLNGEQIYLYGDVSVIATSSFTPWLLTVDAGVAARPCTAVPRLEFRLGTQDYINLHGGDRETGIYLGIRHIY